MDKLKEIQGRLCTMENDALAIIEYVQLLAVLTAGPDAETAMDGIHRLTLEIGDHASNLKLQWDEAWKLTGANECA
jgi:hypothetical protein